MTKAAPDGGARAAPLIVHAVRQFPPRRGGLEDFVVSLCREQLRQGLRVRVVTADRIFTEVGSKLPARETMEGIEVVRIPAYGSRRYPVMPGFLKSIADADLVHVHAIDFFFDAMALTRFIHGKPLIATTHGGFFHSGDFSALKKLFFNSVTRLSARQYAAVIGCSSNDFRLFEPLCGERMHLIENGVNLGKFAGAGSREPAKGMVTIGRFSKNKRLDNLIAATRALAARDPDWRLDIVGVPYDDDEASLRAMIERAGIESRVRLHVGIPDAQIRDLLGKASLFVSASEFEGFGLALVEAMSAGLVPVVQANTTFVDFEKRHGGAVLADFADPEGAAAAIAAAYDRLVLEGTAQAQARMVRIAGTFAWPAVARTYSDLYQAVLAAQGSVAPLPARS